MKYYIDIKLLPDEDVPLYFIRNKVCTKLHRTLFDLCSTEIGLSFPFRQANKLGDVIRLHGIEEKLVELQVMNWLGGLSSYCNVSDIQAIPLDIKYQAISRKQRTMSLSKLKKRVKHQCANGMLKTEADIKAYRKQYITEMNARKLDNPYLELESSKGHRYRRYIQFGEELDNPVEGKFDTFGLSKKATIPWF